MPKMALRKGKVKTRFTVRMAPIATFIVYTVLLNDNCSVRKKLSFFPSYCFVLQWLPLSSEEIASKGL